MPSSPLGSTNGQTTSGVVFHHRLCAAQAVRRRRAWHAIITFGKHIVKRRRAWHAIIAFGKHTRSNNVGRGMPLSTSGSTNDRTTCGVACHHHLWEAHTFERRRAWPAIIAFGLGDTVGRRQAWHAIIALGRQTRSNDFGPGMPSTPFGSTHSRTTSGVACHHRLWEAQTVEQRRARHEITALGLHTPSDDVGRGMTSPPLYCMHGRKTSGVA